MNSDTGIKADTAPGEYSLLPIRPPHATVVRRPDGSIIIEQNYAMPEAWPSIPHLFAARARQHPERAFVAQRERLANGGFGAWQTLSYGEALTKARALAQAMIDLGVGPDASVMVLSGPSRAHMLFNIAAQMARTAYTPVSPNFALWSGDFAKLKHAVSLCRPKLIFAEDAEQYRAAMEAIADPDRIFVAAGGDVDGLCLSLDDLFATAPTSAVDESIAVITPDTHAKTIFTSGSTGRPKAVIQTQGMLTAVIQQHDALYIHDEADGEGEAYLSWMPWSHVGPNNIVIGDVINDGATYYIDDGKPVPGQFEETVRNLRDIHPRQYSSAPIFFAHLVAAMEADDSLRDGFFSRLRYLNYSNAGLSQDIFNRIQALAIAATGRKIPIITKYGATETQGMTITSWPIEQVGPIGLPFPGVTVKLAPVGNRMEVRIKANTVTPGYLNDPAATAAAFDEEGFYCTGDAGTLTDPDHPERGITFDGRVSENFKLSSGTWVSVGALRVDLIRALAPIVQDIVIAGENREYLGALLWLRPAETASLTGGLLESDHPAVRAHLAQALAKHNAIARGSSRRIRRALVLDLPPEGDEIADKGYVNQREVLRSRPDAVKQLYSEAPDDAVLIA